MATSVGSKPCKTAMKAGGFYNDNSSLKRNAVQLALPLLRKAAACAAHAYLAGQEPRGSEGQTGAPQKPFWVLEMGCSQVGGCKIVVGCHGDEDPSKEMPRGAGYTASTAF